MYKIAVLDYRLPKEVQEEIQKLSSSRINFPKERCPEAERVFRTGDADIVLITPWEKIDTEYLDACPNLKYICLCGTSTANIDLEEVEQRGISFTSMKTGGEDKNARAAGGKQAVAEFFFMQLVRLARGIGVYQWQKGRVLQLKGRKAGIIGLGAVGQGIARMALAYNMDVSYHGPNRKRDWENKGVKYSEKNELLATSDVVFLCSPTNTQVIDSSSFHNMKPGKILVQACGGSPFDKDAFYQWVEQEGNYAIFDMSAGEQNYQLYKDMPNVIFSKDVAGDTYESNLARGRRALKHLKEFISRKSSK